MADKSQFHKWQRKEPVCRYPNTYPRENVGWIVALILVGAVALLVAGVLVYQMLTKDKPDQQISTEPLPSTTVPTETEPEDTTNAADRIQLVFGGDLVVNDLVVNSGATENGGYDYSTILQDIAPVLASANVAGINFEGNTVGKPYGTASTSAPKELLAALAAAGVDVVQLANTCTINNGILGLNTTLQEVVSAGMTPVGAYGQKEQAQQQKGYTLCQIGELRVAMVGFTKGFDGLSLPQNSQWCANLLYSDYASAYKTVAETAILDTLKSIEAQKPDLTIALVHWGSTYNNIISASQQEIEELMLENGVDAIVGTHSHYVQQVKFDPEAGTVVAYSLGDLFSGGEKNGTQYSILLQLEVTRDHRTGQTKITGCDYVPIYTLTPERDEEPMRIVRIDATMEQYESSHIHRVNAKAYENMKNALAKIRSAVGF